MGFMDRMKERAEDLQKKAVPKAQELREKAGPKAEELRVKAKPFAEKAKERAGEMAQNAKKSAQGFRDELKDDKPSGGAASGGTVTDATPPAARSCQGLIHRPASRDGRSLSAARMSSTGACSPVISATCTAAWCNSISAPLITRAPAVEAAAASAEGHGS